MVHLRRLAPAGLVLLLASCTDSPPSVDLVAPPVATPSTSAPAVNPAAELVPRGKVKEMMTEARKAGESGNLAGAATLYEEVLKLDPANREALFLLAAVSQDRAIDLERPRSSAPLLRSASAMRQLRTAQKALTEDETALLQIALFNEARTHAVDGKPEKALDSLVEAVDAGYSALEPMRNEPELESVRKLPRFQNLIKKVEHEARALAHNAAQDLLAKNRPFPFAFKLPDVDGKTLSSDDLRGKVVIADIWGTWCPPCRKEIPHLIDLSKRFKDKGLQVVGLNYERVPEDEVKKTITDFVKEFGVTYPCLIGDDKTRDQVPDFQGFPTTLMLDRSGKVRAMLVGFNPDNSVAIMALEEIVTMLLAE